jgi:hypothetical protein
MTIRPIPLALAALLLLQGCATGSVQRGKDVSSAAIAYSEATVAVIDVAIDAVIDNDSESQVQSPLAAVPAAQRAGRLEQLDKGLVRSVQLYAELKQSVSATRAYFIALQDLANGSPAEATEKAVESLARRVGDVNGTLEGDGAASGVSDEKAAALGGLAGLVAAQIHGAKVSRALERDAEIIGRALLLQEEVLKQAGDDIRAYLKATNNRLFRTRVRIPYEKAALGPDWVADRRTYLKTRALGENHASLQAADAAAAKMQIVWTRILGGSYSAGEIAASLNDSAELLDAVVILRDVDKPK